jgi:NAD(P)H-hydrate epimerase
MMKNNLELLTTSEMAEADLLTITGGTPGIALMEAAGAAVADIITARYTPRPTLVICGPGNNGGDGFVIARLLAAGRWPVRLALASPVEKLKGDAALAAQRWPGSIEDLSPDLLKGKELIVDALFGAGLDRPVEGPEREMIETIVNHDIETVAVDIPSGVNGNTGEIMGTAINAALTVTFFRKKPGHLLMPGTMNCGETIVVDIGIADGVLTSIAPTVWENDPALWLKRFPWPKQGDHKYIRGHALAIAGKMTGAARLAAHGLQRSGAGMVTLACPPDVVPIFAADSPSLIVHSFKTPGEIETLIKERKVKAVVIGPGCTADDTLAHLIDIVIKSELPAVFDAGALTMIAKDVTVQARLKAHHVLTPHDGEFARLFDYRDDRLTNARRAAEETGVTIVLKGHDTIVANAQGRAIINSNAPSWLGTAGAGDTLAGIIGGLLTQGMAPLDAAAAGVWIHAQAAQHSGYGMIADDLAGLVPKVLQELSANNS